MASSPHQPAAVTGAHPPNLLRSVAKNAVSLTGGRFLLALLRFAVALVIVKRSGLDTFGEFALVLTFIFIAEWLSDFGLIDIAVRQICTDTSGGEATLGAFAISKCVQSVLAAAMMVAGMALLGYPSHVMRSGMIAGVAILLYGGVQYLRVGFRVRMTMERDVGAELASVVFLLGAVWIATGARAGLEVLTLCYVFSRGVNLVGAWLLAAGSLKPAFGKTLRSELAILVRAALPLGLTGLLVVAYDSMDAIALSRWSTNAQIGVFSVATRAMMLAVVAEQALCQAVFPVLARQWAQDRATFTRTYQAVLDWGTVLAGVLFCALFAGALGLGALVRQEPQAVAAVLQLLSWAVLARAVVTLVSPMVVISGRLMNTVWITLLVVVAKWAGLVLLARQGAIGAATAYLIAEVLVGLVPTVIICQRAAGVSLDWSLPLRAVAAAAAVAGATQWLELQGNVLHGLLAVLLYVALAWALGAIRLQPLRQFWLAIGRGRGDG
jgi:O-antigen/teichoic acid export membrane protein